MRILLTNNTLDQRAGSELFLRDVALALLRRGHEPIAYSTRLGDVARELRAATVPVIDDLAELALAPDLIHGQHHLDAMTAMLHFPAVPAIHYCHGFLPWQEMPARFPSIHAFIAVDDLCAERLHSENGIDPARIRIIRNFVDLERFTLRAPLPERPRRALIFSNYAQESGYVCTIRRACAEEGLELDVIGLGVGRSEAQPERLLGDYDLVFAKARAALEALATGNAVVACDANGLGGMVTPADYERFRRLNFGARILHRPITVPAVRDEIRRYDAASAREVSLRARGEVGLDQAVDALIALYGETIAAHRPIDLRAALHDAGRYMASISDIAKGRAAEAMALHLARTEAHAQGERARRGEEELSASRREHERLSGLLGARDAALADAERELAELRARATVQHTALADTERELAELRARAAAQQTALADRERELEGLRVGATAQQTALAEAERELEGLRVHASAQQTALADAKGAAARLRGRAEKLEARLAARNQPWSLRLGWRRAKKVVLKQLRS